MIDYGPMMNPDGSINFNPVITVNPQFNNNPSFENVNQNANIGGTGKTETTTTPGHWETTETTKKIGGSNRESYEEAWARKKDKYMTKGQKSRMGTDKNKYNVFKNIDEYIDYMERVKEYKKTEEGKEWSKKNRKSSKERTITTKSETYVPGTTTTKTIGNGGTGNITQVYKGKTKTT